MDTLYLCGAINGCTDSEAKDWRERVKSELGRHYTILDPMRRDYRGVEDDSVTAIVQGDITDIKASDVVLVAADRPSWGTAMELFFAFTQGKYTVVVCGAERVSPWLRFHASNLFWTLDAAVAHLRERGRP